MSISLYPYTALLPCVWELRDDVSAYAAAYIALAETLEAPPRYPGCSTGAGSGYPRGGRSLGVSEGPPEGGPAKQV